MRTITKEELAQILENHKHWLNEDCDGWENMRADLQEANLREADLWRADLQEANLREADLWGANLQEANLREADLQEANLWGADLRRANLRRANLWRADLRRANLREADLQEADLQEANLWGADLREADLRRANLWRANLRGANLWIADLRGAKNVPFVPLACPDTGAFVGWKKVNGLIIKLQIPEDARRSSATTTKCRCDKALVLAIERPDGSPSDETSVRNTNYAGATYTVGEMVYPNSFDEGRWNECSHGIHFFINRQEAVDW